MAQLQETSRRIFTSWEIVLLEWTFFCLLLAGPAWAQDVPAGKIVNLRGQVDIQTSQDQSWQKAQTNQALIAGTTIRTGNNGWAAVLLADETLLQINNNSRFVLSEVLPSAGWQKIQGGSKVARTKDQSLYKLLKGESWLRNKNRDVKIQVTTPSATCGVRGTEMNLRVASDDTLTLTVLEGRVQASNEQGSLDVGPREQVTARRGGELTKSLLIHPEDAVQWTIPIPPGFDDRDAPEDVRIAYHDLLAGQVKQVRDRLETITARNPQQSPAWSLLAITYIMLGQKQEALSATEKAVAADPRSVMALIVQSYAFQSSYDLDRALAATRQALAIDRQSVPALMNLARLRFGMDDIDEALSAIQEAQRLTPDNGEAQNLLGFILLGRERTDEAIAAFKRAALLDPSLGEPHMGLGIAYMRKSDTAGAMEEMSTAVLLEPRKSLFLSYWGKMLYQIERFDKALDMLKLAGELDPRDPTPELYKSFVYRDQNRPTEAINAVNQSIKLNDNRAVYRSRFLLDRDAAVKNVDLSILYNQLGLSGWARSKALASVKQDYTNASGHLFLAGSMHDADDRSWPMQSEYLLARMLMPANVNSFNTFNEYTAFFEKPSLDGTITGSVSNHDGKAGDIIAYGAVPAGNVAFGAQVSYNGTDGWRDTNGEESKNVAALFKWNPTQKDGFMAVASYQKANKKDTAYPRFEYYPRFNNDRISDPSDWTDSKVTLFELGYHRNFSPNSNLLVYASHLGSSGILYDRVAVMLPLPLGPVDSTTDYRRPYTQLQGQYMHKLGPHQMILGTNQYWGDNEQALSLYLSNWNITAPTTKSDKRQNLQSYYIQDTWRIAGLLTMEGAVYLDHMLNSDPLQGTNGTYWSLTEWGGRIGAIITPTRTDTFRLATFRYLLPFITSRLDPTDIAGVPVFRNNSEGSLMEECHGVWEHEWSSGYVSADLFYLEKKYSHKIINTAGSEVMQDERGRMKGLEAGLNQLLWRGLGLVASYRYEDIKDDNLPVNDREEHLVNAGLRYVHSSGVSAGLTETWRWERFKTADWRNSQTWPLDGRENQHIWLTDARFGYEFPGKRGSLSCEIRNIFDDHFNWVTDYFVFRGRAPVREMILTLSVNF